MQIPTPVNDTNVSFAKPIQALSKARRVSRTRRNLKSRRRPAANQTRAAQDRNPMINRLPRIAKVWLAIAIGLALSASFLAGLADPAMAQGNSPPDKGGGDEIEPRSCSAPPAPSNFEVTAGSGNTQVTASWDAVTDSQGGVLSYHVIYKLSSSTSYTNHHWPGQETTTTITGLTSGSSYDFKVRAFVVVDGYDCDGTLSDVESVTLGSTTTPPIVTPTTPGPPTNLAAARHSTISNRLSVTFTRSESPHYYQFELWSASSEHGSYSLVTTATQNVSISPADFGNQTRERWYKARGNNCSTASRTNCGAWSPLSNAVWVPPVSTTPPPITPSPSSTATPNTQDPPTNLVVTRDANSILTVSVSYTQSSGSIHNYQIELHTAATENGTYVLQATSNDSTASPAVFQYQPTGSWFKARGRNCNSAERTDCGTWSDWSAAIPPPTYIFLTNLPSSIEATESVSVSGWAFYLDPLRRYSIRVTTGGSDIGFNSDCTDTQEDITVPTGSSFYNFRVVPSLYGCDASDGTVNAVLLSGASTVATATPEDIAVTPPSMIAVDPQNPYAGQTVTMTATAPTSRGAVTSYRWQEFSAGQWSDLTSATSSQSVPSDASGKRVFKVEATYTSGKKEDSAWVLVDWKPITVTITASPDNPESGDATKNVVTLTATADAPSGVTYQWQQGSGNTWTNLDAAATSSTKTVSFSTRGTRKFKVLVQHTTASPAESEAIYVTWDEWAIMGDLVTALRTAVTGDAIFVSAQTALVTCINTTTPVPTTLYTSFDDILDGYTGETKSKMDAGGECSSEATMMFGKNQDLHRSKLATLKSGSSANASLYAALLETPQGSQFEANVGDSDTLKRLAYLGATVGTPGSLEQPLYVRTLGGSAPAPRNVSREQGPGLGCLPTNVAGARLTLRNKLLVLNCLIFDTPHSFWVRGDASSREAKQLKREIDSPSGRYAWLKRGDWLCSPPAPQGPVPSCLKHDVAYGGLQKLGGLDAVAPLANDPDGDELDEAWNPRNKALADEKLRADIRRYGCQDQSGDYAAVACLITTNEFLAQRFHDAVAKTNDKGWPVTTQDLTHFGNDMRFTTCAAPYLPRVSNLTFSGSGNTFTAGWNFESGCVVGLDGVVFSLNLHTSQGAQITTTVDPSADSGACTATGQRATCSYTINTPRRAYFVLVEMEPRQRAYGGLSFPSRVWRER